MEAIRKILAPTDASEFSKVGVRAALQTAMKENAEVILYYVADAREGLPYPVGPETRFKTMDRVLEEHKKQVTDFVAQNFRELEGKVKLRVEAGAGVPHERIVEKAEAESVDMIVMSTHGRTGIAHALLGSVTEQVVRRAPCPVLSVRPLRKTKAA